MTTITQFYKMEIKILKDDFPQVTKLAIKSSIQAQGEGDGTPLQYSCLENPMDGGAWWATVHGVAKSQTWLSNFTFTFHFYFSLSCTGEGNGNPFQCSCLENPRNGRAWWAAIYGVALHQTQLKWLSSSSIQAQFNQQSSIFV